MKYYLYISKTKIDMLYEQIPLSLKKRLSTKVKVDLKFVAASFSDTQNESERSLYSKVGILEKFIEKNEKIGTIDSPESYFKGVLDLRWGPLFSRVTETVYFGGMTNSTILGLAGSLRNVIGESQTTPIKNVSNSRSSLSSLVPIIKHVLDQQKKEKIIVQDYYDLLSGIENINKALNGPKQKLEFLAKRLLDSDKYTKINSNIESSNKRIVLGTPIYVALVE